MDTAKALVRGARIKGRCQPERSEGSASKRRKTIFIQAFDGKKIFRLYSGESIEDDLYRNYKCFENENRQHREGRVPRFTSKYRIHRLVHFEILGEVHAAIRREKERKGWRRKKKVALIERTNPNGDDLSEEWFPKYPSLERVPHL